VRRRHDCDERLRACRTRCGGCGTSRSRSKFNTSTKRFAATMHTTALPGTAGLLQRVHRAVERSWRRMLRSRSWTDRPGHPVVVSNHDPYSDSSALARMCKSRTEGLAWLSISCRWRAPFPKVVENSEHEPQVSCVVSVG
jgi:hypothetical protein